MTIFKQQHVFSNSLCYAVITSKSVLTDVIVANNYSHYWNGLFKYWLSNGYTCLNKSHCLQIVTKLFKHICFCLLWVFRTRNSHNGLAWEKTWYQNNEKILWLFLRIAHICFKVVKPIKKNENTFNHLILGSSLVQKVD